MENVLCPEDRSDWVIVGPRATEGCYIEGGGFNCYIAEEIGEYLDHRAAIRPGPDREFSKNPSKGTTSSGQMSYI